MSLEKVQQALIARAKTFAEGKTFPVAWENVSFTKPDAAPWLAVFFIPVNNQIDTLGEGGTDREDGMLQIDVNYPLNSGESTMRATVDALKTCFYNGLKLTFQGQPVTILSASCSGGREADGFYKKSVTIRWNAYITRPTQ